MLQLKVMQKKVCDPTHPTCQKSTQHIFNFKFYWHIGIIHLIYCLWQAELLMSYATKKGILRYKLNQVIYTYLSVIYYTCMFGIAFLGKLIILRNNPKDLCWKRITTKYNFKFLHWYLSPWLYSKTILTKNNQFGQMWYSQD